MVNANAGWTGCITETLDMDAGGWLTAYLSRPGARVGLSRESAGLPTPKARCFGTMDQPRIVFEPYASGAQREVVEEILNRRNVAITGHDGIRSSLSSRPMMEKFLADCSVLSGRSDCTSLRSR
jgi:hypothetical protein